MPFEHDMARAGHSGPDDRNRVFHLSRRAWLIACSMALLFTGTWCLLGSTSTPTRNSRMQHSPQWKNGKFHNPQPLWNDYLGAVGSILRSNPHKVPGKGAIPWVQPSVKALESSVESGLRATWLGHSTVYLEIDGTRILTDPVWGKRASPFSWVGPRRWYAPVISLEQLPRPHVVSSPTITMTIWIVGPFRP